MFLLTSVISKIITLSRPTGRRLLTTDMQQARKADRVSSGKHIQVSVIMHIILYEINTS